MGARLAADDGGGGEEAAGVGVERRVILEVKMRKIIQICQMPSGEEFISIAALCNDGTVWIGEIETTFSEGTAWYKVDPIPQPKDEMTEKRSQDLIRSMYEGKT